MTEAESSLVGIDVGAVSAALEAEDDVPPTLPAGTRAPDLSRPVTSPEETPAATRADATPAEAAGEIVSATLAEVHIEQGHIDEAKAMYHKLLEREPDNQQARRRLAELQAEAPRRPAPADRETVVRRQIAALERMLEGVRRG
jgi:hypothetical protein